MRKFQSAKMRRVFYSWHGGQTSPLYAAASSGLVADIGALQRELRACAESLWEDKSNFVFYHVGIRQATASRATESSMRASVYAEWKYLRDLADYLPHRFKTEVIVQGRAYTVLPWVSRTYFGAEK